MTTKNSFPKIVCDICGRMVSIIGLNAHKKTDICKASLTSNAPFQPNKPEEVLKIYSAYNKSKRDRLIESIGIDEVRKQENERKIAQRAKKKEEAQPTPTPEPVPTPVKAVLPKRNQNKIPKPKGEQSSKPTGAKPEDFKVEPEPAPTFVDKKEFIQEFLKITNAKRPPSKWIKETTAELYVTDFYKFAQKYTGSEVDFTNLKWLTNVEKVVNYIENKWKRPNGTAYATTTQRNMMVSLGSIASMLGMKKVSTEYNEIATKANQQLKKTS